MHFGVPQCRVGRQADGEALVHAVIQGPRLVEDRPSTFLPATGERNAEDRMREILRGQFWKLSVSYLFTFSLAIAQSHGHT